MPSSYSRGRKTGNPRWQRVAAGWERLLDNAWFGGFCGECPSKLRNWLPHLLFVTLQLPVFVRSNNKMMVQWSWVITGAGRCLKARALMIGYDRGLLSLGDWFGRGQRCSPLVTDLIVGCSSLVIGLDVGCSPLHVFIRVLPVRFECTSRQR